MSSFKAFCRKEVIEGHRSKRIYILMGIFLVFGMARPVLARYMQEIMSLAMGSGAPILISEPVWTDSWSQFYSNFAQLGGICILLLFMSSVSGEKISKSALLTLTKNLTPAEFIICLALPGSLGQLLQVPGLILCLPLFLWQLRYWPALWPGPGQELPFFHSEDIWC